MSAVKILNSSDDANSIWHSDFLNHEGINVYYTAREAIKAFSSYIGINQRRELAYSVIEALEKFIIYNYTDDEFKLINKMLTANKQILERNVKTDTGLFTHLLKLDSQGVALLEIDKDIDLEKLKKLYKTASKKFHPDLGGDLEIMKKVNEVYSLFHDAISYFIPDNRLGNDLPTALVGSFSELVFSAHLILSNCYADFYAADKAFTHLEKSYEISLSEKSLYIGQFIQVVAQVGLYKTCKILSTFNMKQEKKLAASWTSYFFDRMVYEWNKNNTTSEESDNLQSDFFSFEDSVKIVIKHPEQAKNAYRLNKIDKKRYDKAMKQFDVRKNDSSIQDQLIEVFSRDEGFILKTTSESYTSTSINPQIISPPNYYITRFSHLEEEQKWQYVKCFGGSGDVAIFNKYYNVRTQQILLGLINNYESVVVQGITKEIEYFKNKLAEKFPNYLLLHEFYFFLQNLNVVERNQRLSILESLDDSSPESFNATFTFNLGSFSTQTHTKRIRVSRDYIEFATMELEEINKFKINGTYENDFQKSWVRDLDSLKKYQKTSVAKARSQAWLKSAKKPEKVIETSEPYLLGLLEVGKSFHPRNVGELQIGFEIDRITVAFAKLNNWGKVIYWSELFFNLDASYRERSSRGEQEKIEKRLLRAQKCIK